MPVLQAIVANAARVLKSLPKTPVRRALLHELTLGVPVNKAADALGVNRSNVSRASEYHDRPFVEFLRQLGFPRTNRAESHQFLRGWLNSDANCPVPSGENKRCYTGSPETMWAEYAAASLASSIAPLQPETFHAVRLRMRVGIREGDIFINRDEVELAELTRQIESDPALREEYAIRMGELEASLKFCKERKKFYRDCHQQLKGNPKKMVVTVDFTATQTGMQDKFSNFVVVVCTDGPLYVPLSLVNETVEPEEPQSKRRIVEKPVIEKKSRRKKLEIAESGKPGRKLLPSWTQEKAKLKQKEQPAARDMSNVYKPKCTVFHFVIRRSEDTPGQISPYVQWALNFLFVTHDLACCYDDVQLFSDGCGKHFKTYPTHWYIADLQQHLRANNSKSSNNNSNTQKKKANAASTSPTIVWDFLPPGDAHNRCDAAAAHWKRPQKKFVRDFCVLTSVGHLAFACAEMRNCYMIEAVCSDFPDPLDCLIDETWMRDAFHFEYGTPREDYKHCKHISNGKCGNGCMHACCNKVAPLLPCVDITIRDRDGKYEAETRRFCSLSYDNYVCLFFLLSTHVQFYSAHLVA